MSDKVVEAIEIQNFEEATIKDAKKVMQNMFNDITPEQFEELKKQAIENVKQNNMSAKEMFNELHFYEVVGEYIDDSKCYIKTIGKEYKKIALIKDEEILICLENIDILTDKELQAINKQIEELGWK